MQRRLLALATAVLVLVLGLGVRAVTGGLFAKYAGIALYATLVYLLMVLVAPRIRPWRAAVTALGFCWVIELLQLTPVPAELSGRNHLLRLVFGTTFNPPDLVWYAVGVAVPAGLHRALTARRR